MLLSTSKLTTSKLNKSQLSSPQRSTINYLSQDLDSPSRQRIKLLSDKWNHIQNGIDKDKVEKREVLEERIKIIEDVLASEKPKDEQKFKVIKDSVLKLQDQAHNQKSEREAFDDKKEKDFRTLSDNIALSFEQERNIRGQGETKLQKQIDERFAQITLTITRNTHQYEDRSQAKISEVLQQIQVVKNQLDQERRSREESAESLSEQIDSEINKFSDQLLVEKKVREETQGKIFRMIEDVHGKLQQDINFERREREATTEALLKLLEDACIKIDKNFRSF
ncbi:unnamed protein product (macronuclear) [Paramecium tetraurelia]|uniref:SF-assemblin n=1 Tax=Paramecium tetraurelia TaxID=5888 RepID=A0CLX4_PARTE|nr:uncharacterized protein GSPATT00008270001 [Paramecium tetraurelia]CAK71791.1 unnamed protein product [Paramecium tetraurelia]|eukprot:XP_001439188.1 hypothetical protein (macronuclear) [Paramecium tetraurelia strain d4-2]